MNCVIMYGKPVVEQIKTEILRQIVLLGRQPTIATLGFADNEEWRQYTTSLATSANQYNCQVSNTLVNNDIDIIDIQDILDSLNKDDNIDGILLQQPLPPQYKHLSNLIVDYKDIDSLTNNNIFGLYCSKENMTPATPMAVVKLLDYYNIGISGKNIAIIGRGLAVGRPLSLMLINRNATVTVCHTRTVDTAKICRDKDIIVCACGVPSYLTAEFVKKDAVVVDVGLSFLNGVACGDVESSSVSQVASHISPVPGGVGPITRACLFANVLTCINKRNA